MTKTKGGIVILSLLMLLGCGVQIQRQEASQTLIKEEEEKRREPYPTITYRPGGGLTITGDP